MTVLGKSRVLQFAVQSCNYINSGLYEFGDSEANAYKAVRLA